MVEVTKVYRQDFPAVRFIGKKYGDADRVNGGFGTQWHQWFENQWFAALAGLASGLSKDAYPDIDACVGLMRWKDGEPFEYRIGMFTPPNTPVPEGFSSVDMPAGGLGVAWLQGPESEIFGKEEMCAQKLVEAGWEIAPDAAGAWWFFERYVGERFAVHEGRPHPILDICHFIQ